MPRPIRALISRGALRHNLARARSLAPAARVWAVIKANAYGHGIEHLLPALGAADGLALLELDAAVRLRELGWRRPVLLLEGAFEPADVATAASSGLTLVVHCMDQVRWLGESMADPVDVVVKLNTGMNRLGFGPGMMRPALEALRGARGVRRIGLMTHFANADGPIGVSGQLARFEAETAGFGGERTLANSAALIAHPVTHADWVRPGIMLYGASPFDDRSAAELGLAPVMSLQARIIATQTLAAGDGVGYGFGFVAARPMRIGIVACGYADGYPRHAASGTPIAIDGHRTGTVGRVSMDMLAVDLSDLPSAGVGSLVELWGALVPIDEVARAAGTIGYELMCGLARRVPSIVVDA